jgi:preprotein translocase subunit SecB
MTDNLNQSPSVGINGQYIKDLSFENPKSPESFTKSSTPQIEVSLNLEAAAMANDTYEVTLKISTTAKVEESVLFVAELAYAGLFTLTNIPEDQKELILLIHCPSLLFPFARRIISDVTRDGGFQPLLLDPIDFAGLYQQRKAQGELAN